MGSAKDFGIRKIEFDSNVMNFIKTGHYSQTCPSSTKYAFGIFDQADKMIGCLLIGSFSRNEATKKYMGCLELTRLYILDCTPKNTESYFIGWCLRWLKKNVPDLRGIVSYADPTVGHKGVVYQASNFKHIGISGKSYHYEDEEGTRVHKRQVWGRASKNEQIERDQANEEGLVRVREDGKIIYCYEFKDGVIDSFGKNEGKVVSSDDVRKKVYFHAKSGKWVASVLVKGKENAIGYFPTEEQAIVRSDEYSDQVITIGKKKDKAVIVLDCDVPNDFDPNIHECIGINGRVFYVDKVDLPSIFSKSWVVNSVYMAINNKRKGCKFFHRIKMGEPDNLSIDHANGLKNDNRECNLRAVSPSANNHNREFSNKSGFRGVKYVPKRGYFLAYIRFQYGRREFQPFVTAEEAAKRYDIEAVKIYGSSAQTNFDISNYEIPEKCESQLCETFSFKRLVENRKCATEDCEVMIRGRKDYCDKCLNKRARRELADKNGRSIKKYVDRVDAVTDQCTHEGCVGKTFARNLCSYHYDQARKEEGFKKKTKIKYKCTVDGCPNVRWKHKEGLCKAHWNEKNGVVTVRTGRPQKSAKICVSCGSEVKGTVKGLCNKCYLRNYHGRGGVISNDVICKELV